MRRVLNDYGQAARFRERLVIGECALCTRHVHIRQRGHDKVGPERLRLTRILDRNVVGRSRNADKHRHAATHFVDTDHPLYRQLAEAKATYWDIYKEKAKLPAGMNLFKYSL